MALTTSRGSSRRVGGGGTRPFMGVGGERAPSRALDPPPHQPSSGGRGTLGPLGGETIPNASVPPLPRAQPPSPSPTQGQEVKPLPLPPPPGKSRPGLSQTATHGGRGGGLHP